MLGKQAIRIVKPWQLYQVGAVIYPTGTLREFLITGGFGELVKKRGRPRVNKAND